MKGLCYYLQDLRGIDRLFFIFKKADTRPSGALKLYNTETFSRYYG